MAIFEGMGLVRGVEVGIGLRRHKVKVVTPVDTRQCSDFKAALFADFDSIADSVCNLLPVYMS